MMTSLVGYTTVEIMIVCGFVVAVACVCVCVRAAQLILKGLILHAHDKACYVIQKCES